MQKNITYLYGIQRGGDKLNTSKMSKVLKCEGLCFKKDMNIIYNIFFKCFMKKENRPLYNGKFIFFNMAKDINITTNGITVIQKLSVPERFIHIISLENGWKKYNVPPCNNDNAIEYCKNECKLQNSTITEFRLVDRTECYYRLMRINRIPQVLELANNNDSNIEEWTEVEKDKKKNNIYKRFIRYKHKKDDYIVILKENRRKGQIENYNFLTAFPLFYRDNKEEFNKKYRNYIKKVK